MATTPDQMRRELLLELRDQDDQTAAMLNAYIVEVERAARQYPNNPDMFGKIAIGLIAALLIDFERIAVNSNRNLATKFVSYVQSTLVTDLRTVGATRTAAAINRSLNAHPASVAGRLLTRRHPADGRNFAGRIVTLQRGSERVVNGLISLGLERGLSVNEIARSIQGYIDPASQFGRRVTSGSSINYRMVSVKDPRVRKGSIKYNAVRIARSELMQSYDLSNKQYYEDKRWNKGYNWKLSNTHIHEDGCDILAAASPHKKLPPRPHPQCACRTEPIPYSMQELARLVRSGKLS